MNRLNFFALKVVVAISAIALIGNQMLAAWAKPLSQKYATLYKEMLASVTTADKQLSLDMETVAQALQEFADGQGHFPDTGDDLDGLALELSAALPMNPYEGSNNQPADASSEQRTNATGDFLDEYTQESAKVRARLVFDPSLKASIVDKLCVEPYATWTAKPGTVVAVTNGYDLCLVWGAGVDEKPVRDDTGKVRMTILRTCD